MHLSASATDADILAAIDRWASLLEQEEYEAAFALSGQVPHLSWDASILREVIKAYGDADPAQRVTLDGVPTDISQRKEIDWWVDDNGRTFGQAWYDLNIDGKASDLLPCSIWSVQMV